MLANSRLERECLEVANTLAYYNAATITSVKGFIVQATSAFYNFFTGVWKASAFVTLAVVD